MATVNLRGMGWSLLVTAVVTVITAATAVADTAEFHERLTRLADDHKGQVAIAVKHLTTGESFTHNADRPMPTASLIKVAVMVEAYRQAAEGELDLSAPVTLREDDKVPGSGVLTPHFSAGVQLPLRDMIRLMMAYSDNTATNLVLDHVGLKAVAVTMERLGLPNTKMHSKVYRRDTSIFPERSEEFGLGSTTAAEMRSLLEQLYRQELASAEHTKEMLDHLKACESENRLPRELPSGTVIAHKTGSINAVRTDAGIIESPSGPFIIVVLTAENEDQRWTKDNAAEILAGRLAKVAYDHFNPTPDEPEDSSLRELAEGSQGWLVEALQRTLNARAEPSPRLSVDGDFGPVTKQAVLAFQESRELPETGVVDEATWSALGPLITSNVPITDPAELDLELPPREPADPLEGVPFVTCRGWIVADVATKAAIGGDQMNRPRENASTTKLMTAWLVMRTAKDDPEVLDEIVTVSPRSAKTPGSTANLQAGEQIPLGELLYGLLLPSGNDASVAIAEHLGSRFAPPESDPETDDPLERFVAEMNRTAKALGMNNTTFRNPHGLSARGHRTTPRDLFTLAATIVEDGSLLPIVRTRKHVGQLRGASGYVRYELWSNTNRLLNTEGYLGMKTGTTTPAGACLVTLAERDGRQLIAVVLGSTSNDARYSDTRNLLRWAWKKGGKDEGGRMKDD